VNVPSDSIRPGHSYRGKGRGRKVAIRRVVAIGPEHRPEMPDSTRDGVGVLFVSPDTGTQGRMSLAAFGRWAQSKVL